MGILQNIQNNMKRMHDKILMYEERLERLDDEELIEKYRKQRWSCNEERIAYQNVLKRRGYGNNN